MLTVVVTYNLLLDIVEPAEAGGWPYKTSVRERLFRKVTIEIN
ncbi:MULTISPECIES: hypothetical protein [Citrobacter]|nr:MULTISPECIES: hypothetical protein [Citrobacter]MDM3156070.1 hypothetical protein [Citrobacter sp. Cf122]